MKLVILESPYAGDAEANLAYGRACLRDCLMRDEAPFASHMIYTQYGVLDDIIPADRVRGIRAGLRWAEKADLTVVYTDLGISTGMEQGIKHAEACNRPVEYRSIYGKVV